MRRRQVRVVGNCQAAAVAHFYRDFVGAPAQEDVRYIDDLGRSVEELRGEVADADVVIVQERDFKHGLSREELGGRAEVFSFPQILAGFLWPFANEPHVHNVAERPISDGPYPSQVGDSFLNRLIVKGVAPEAALSEYLALDIGKAAHLDRMFELYIERQRERDRATGFEVAKTIEDGFRTEKMFLTAEHPEGRLFGVMAAQLFDRMDVPRAATEAGLKSLFRSPFPPGELPLHPGVIAHFGLTFADETTTYAFHDEGRFTFAEFVLRYMRYENNPGLRRAMHMAGREPPAEVLAVLQEALPLSPRSARGHRELGHALERTGRRNDALPSFERAVQLDAADPDNGTALSHAFREAGRLEEAEAAALDVVRPMPACVRGQEALALARFARGDFAGGARAVQEAVRLRPSDAEVFRSVAIALNQFGRSAEAERYAREGMRLAPDSADHRNLVAETLEGQGRRAEAVEVLKEARAKGCDNDQTYSLLGNFLQRAGDLDGAEAAFAAGAELHGHHRPDLAACLQTVRELRRRSA